MSSAPLGGRPVKIADLPTYVVTLARRKDRRIRLENEASAIGLRSLYFNTDLGLEVDARTIDPSNHPEIEFFPWQLAETDNKWWRRPMKVGELACSLAHLALWRAIADSPHTFALILEDDAVLASQFEGELDLTLQELASHDPSWDLLYLGRRRWGRDSEVGLGRVVSPGYSACLHAYMLSSAGARKLIAADICRRMMPVDEFVPASISVHPRPDVAAAVRPTLRGYACRNDLIGVLPREIWGSETEATPFLPLMSGESPASSPVHRRHAAGKGPP